MKMWISRIIVLVCMICIGFGDETFFESVPKELRCSGCEITVKVLDKMLSKSKPKDLSRDVDHAFKLMCDERRHTISEYKADYMVKTCHFMKDFHGNELRQELIKHYNQTKSTYMELSQQVCLNIMNLCPGHAHRMPDDDESLEHFDHYLKVSGQEAKVPKPVRAKSHDEL